MDEGDELGDLGEVAQVGGDPLEGGAAGPPLFVEDAEGLAQRGDRLGRDPGTAEPDRVQSGDAVVTLLEDEWRDILGGRAKAADHRQSADPDPLLHRRVAR